MPPYTTGYFPLPSISILQLGNNISQTLPLTLGQDIIIFDPVKF